MLKKHKGQSCKLDEVNEIHFKVWEMKRLMGINLSSTSIKTMINKAHFQA